MRTLFDQGAKLNFGCSDVFNNSKTTLPDVIEKKGSSNVAFVTLDIPVDVLQRLIDRHDLRVDEIQCLDQRSKSIVRHAVLIGLLESGSPATRKGKKQRTEKQ